MMRSYGGNRFRELVVKSHCGHLLKMEVLMKAVTNAERAPGCLVDTVLDSAHVSGGMEVRPPGQPSRTLRRVECRKPDCDGELRLP